VVNLVIVSHSARLAEGVAELAAEMGGGEVAIEPAGGLEDGSIGTDAERVRAAVERVRSPDGVLVLMDLGSALMSAEIALEMIEHDGGPVTLSPAPLVEGSVAAAARARAGAALAEVAAEARGALAMKTSQLGDGDGDEAPAAPPADGEALHARLRVGNRLGLHVRPAGRIIELVAGHDAQLELRNAGRSADGRSLTALALLRAGQGDELEAAARGPQARELLAALQQLAEANFGDPQDDEPAAAPATAESTVTVVAPGGALRGVGAVGGLAIGPARWSRPPELDLDALESGTPEEEARGLEAALAVARERLAETAARLPDSEAEIFAAQALLLDDASIIDPARAAIAAGEPAGRAFQRASEAVAEALERLDDPYLRARAVDIRDVAHRVLAALAGTAAAGAPADPGVVVAEELTPSAVAHLDPERAWGIATARGGTLDHAAIVAGALGIPYVIGLGAALETVTEGSTLAVDGDAGLVEVEPDGASVAAFEQRREAAAAARARALERALEPVVLPDGRRVDVFANIGSVADADLAVAHGAEGVGLLRTEFLYLERAEPPSEDEQAAVLMEIARRLSGRPLIVRTLDAGADKPLPFVATDREANPFLGRRGLRLSLAHPDLFSAQLRAILRVAAEHPVAVMFPMVTTLAEVEQARRLLDAARAQVGATAPIEIGVMIEVPAAALRADELAPHLDFFSIGTNDLSQYVAAAERGNPALAPLLEAVREPVLELIASVVAAAERHGRWVGVCGELAGDPEVALRLVKIGVRELSMSPGRIPAVKEYLRER
jgi:phosphocarrier protein FPr